MNENVRRAMEIALQIKDKETTIEQIKGELDELKVELESMLGDSKHRAFGPPKGQKKSTETELMGLKKKIFDVANGKGPLRAPKITKMLRRGSDPKKIKVISSELARMFNAGLAKRVSIGVYEIGKTNAKAVAKASRYSKARVVVGSGVRSQQVLDVLSDRKVHYYRDVAKKLGISHNKVSGTMCHLLRKKSIIAHGDGRYSLAKGAKAKPVKPKRAKARAGAKKPSRGVGVKQRILKAMGDEEISVLEIRKKSGLKQNSLSAGISKLKNEGTIGKFGAGIYKVIDKKARDAYLNANDTKESKAVRKPNGKSATLPRGYWSAEILKVMPVGKPMRPINIIKAMDCSRDKYPSAYMSIYTMGKDGRLKKDDKGCYVNEGVAGKAAPKEQKKTRIPLPGVTIKNFPVKRLTGTQETFLKHQQKSSLSAKIMKVMKHGKEYSIESIAKSIDPNLGKSTYRSCLAKLTVVGFIQRIEPGLFMRV